MVNTIQQRTIHLWCLVVVVVVAEYLLFFTLHLLFGVRVGPRQVGEPFREPRLLCRKDSDKMVSVRLKPAFGCIQSSTLVSIRGTIVVVVVGWCGL